jgi:hypothetical protein
LASRPALKHALKDADLDGSAPELTARTLTDATIWGARGTWRLQLRTTYALDKRGLCKTATTRASTW